MSSTHPRVAIVGMACMVPGAHGVRALWEQLLGKAQPFSRLPAERWDPEIYKSDLPPGRTHLYERGAIVDDFRIDWRTLHLPPLQVERMHRIEKIMLATMCEALADAGISTSGGPHEDAQIFIAASTLGPDPATDHGRRIRRFELAAPVSEALAAQLPEQKDEIDVIIEQLFNLAAPPIHPDSMTTSASLIAGRLANIYDFRGGHVAIDGGMASSLAAIERAVTALTTGACDLALVCGVSPLLTPAAVLTFAHRGYLGPGNPRPFHPQADGTLIGEGCGAVVLRRLSEAAEGKVYACIDGVGSAVSVQKDEREGMRQCITEAVQRVLARTGVAPGEVRFVETRAAGLGEPDTIEASALAEGLSPGAGGLPPLHISSSVPNVGFLQAASGMIALIKAALALSHRRWPAQPAAGPVVDEHLGRGCPGAGSRRELKSAAEVLTMKADERVLVSDSGMGPLSFCALLSAAPVRPAEVRAPSLLRGAEDGVAIVGCGILVPQAGDVPTFWSNILNRVDAISDLPRTRWDLDRLIGASRELGALLKTRLAGVVSIPEIDPGELGIEESALDSLDPSVLLSLLASRQALRDAGYAPGKWDPARVRVILGQLPMRDMELQAEKRVLFANHLQLTAEAMREAGVSEEAVHAVIARARAIFDRDTPPLTAEMLDAFTGLTSAARVAAAYGFRGGAMSVDAACGSALAAVHFGMDSLLLGECDAVLAGGVAYNLLPEYYLSLSMLGFLAPRVEPPFSLLGDGFVPAEGAGVVVLRRLVDAMKGDEPIYAVIRGIGCASDGKGRAVFAPNTNGQQRAIRRALAAARLVPGDLDLVEAHAAGTKVGDRTEMESYAAIFGDRDPGVPLSIGTLKSQIGHLSSAAGIAGLIKVALALSERHFPAGPPDPRPHPELPFGRFPIELSSEARPWVVLPGRRRRAGVSAFGLGGVNYHVVLEEHDVSPPGRPPPLASCPAPPPPQGTRADRFVVELCPVSLPARPPLFSLSGRHLLIIMDPDARELVCQIVERLRQRGARTSVLSRPEDPGRSLSEAVTHAGPIDGVIDLSCFAAQPGLMERPASALLPEIMTRLRVSMTVLRELYERFASAKQRECCFVVVTGMGGGLGLLPAASGNPLGTMLLGMIKGLKQELPHTLAKAIDFDPRANPEEVAEQVLMEIEDGNDRMELGYAPRRMVINLRREVFREADPILRSFAPGEVFLFSGGARGVGFECASALSRLGMRVVAFGRTAPPEPTLPWLEMDHQAFAVFRQKEMMRARARDPSMTPVRFAAEFDGLSRQRELFRNLALAHRFNLPISYERCDITDPADVAALVARVRARWGPVVGVAHGAMVEWSRSLPGKTQQMIDQTVKTKVGGLLNLLDATQGQPVRLFVCFGSGAGRFGNRGQIDYCAANALMAGLLQAKAHASPRPFDHVTIDWTAWQAVGAAAANPDIAQLVQQTGVTSISPTEGVYWFLSELHLGRASETVIFEERMLHDWPCLGQSAEGSGERAVEFDDRGAPLVPGAWPMVDYLLSRTPGRVTFERCLDVERDYFLSQHRLYGTPILPLTFGCEILAEAAALSSPGWELCTGEGLQVLDPLKLHRGAPVRVRASARVVDEKEDARVVEVETRSDLYLRGKLLTRDRLHHRGRFVLRKPGRRAPVRVDLPDPEGLVHARSFFHMAKDPVSLGPLFCCAESILVLENETAGKVRAPRQRDILRDTSYPIFQLDPLILDAAFQIAANWDGHRHRFVSIPMAVERITLGRLRQRSESVRVRARVDRCVDPDTFYDIFIIGDDGTLIMEVKGVHLRRIARVPGET